MSDDDLPPEVSRSVELFLATEDKPAPGLITAFYLVGSVALNDFHPKGRGRGRLTTASDVDFVAVTTHRPPQASQEMAALEEAHARTVKPSPTPTSTARS